MRRMAGYPRGFYSFLVVMFTALTISGLLLLPHMLTMRLDWEQPLEIAGEVRLASAAMHCGAAFLVMTLVGSLATLHMRSGWQRRSNRVSGVLTASLFLILTATAVGIYYFGDEDLSQWSSIIHSAGGLLLVAMVVTHGVIGHRLHNRRVQRYHTGKPQDKKAALVAVASATTRGRQKPPVNPEPGVPQVDPRYSDPPQPKTHTL